MACNAFVDQTRQIFIITREERQVKDSRHSGMSKKLLVVSFPFDEVSAEFVRDISRSPRVLFKQDAIEAYSWASLYHAYVLSGKCECHNVVNCEGLVEMGEKGGVEQ